jgi:hypothetical protein
VGRQTHGHYNYQNKENGLNTTVSHTKFKNGSNEHENVP